MGNNFKIIIIKELFAVLNVKERTKLPILL